MAGKIIVAKYAALQKKYDVTALKPILAAVDRLIAADKARGIQSKIVDISSVAEMKRLKGKAVTREKGERQAKDAVDAIYAATRADYRPRDRHRSRLHYGRVYGSKRRARIRRSGHTLTRPSICRQTRTGEGRRIGNAYPNVDGAATLSDAGRRPALSQLGRIRSE
jgi:hypothetical protein